MAKVLITGTFDIIHPGHLNLIKQAKELGAPKMSLRSVSGSLNFLVVVIARDKNVLKVKGQEPYFNEEQRLENVRKLHLADKVILGSLNNPYEIIELEKPDIIALGYDQQAFVGGLIDLRANTQLHFDIKRLAPFKEDFCKGKSISKAVKDERAGFLLINKESDWTSHDVVAKLRSITKIKQIGHTGTLDPFATGLLICAVGSATKMVGMFDLLPKTYEATIRFGVTSDTYDRTGKIIKLQDPMSKEISSSLSSGALRAEGGKLQTILDSFVGKQEQLPPMYSAKKINGQKLYDLARQGKIIERKPSEIEIFNIEFLSLKEDVLDIKVQCTAGTYIRTLAHDIGQKLGFGAVLWELKRTAIGPFSLDKAVKLSQLIKGDYKQNLIKPLAALALINQAYLKGFKLRA